MGAKIETYRKLLEGADSFLYTGRGDLVHMVAWKIYSKRRAEPLEGAPKSRGSKTLSDTLSNTIKS